MDRTYIEDSEEDECGLDAEGEDEAQDGGTDERPEAGLVRNCDDDGE